MNLEFFERKDFWSGLSLIATGGAAIFIARNYPFGSSLRMGPGYFPTVLGALLIVFGFYLTIMGLRSDAEKLEGGWSLRALIILLSLVLFVDRSRRIHSGDAGADLLLGDCQYAVPVEGDASARSS